MTNNEAESIARNNTTEIASGAIGAASVEIAGSWLEELRPAI